MMMGCVVERAFKDDYVISLVRAPEVPGNIYINIYTFRIYRYFDFDYVQS